MGKKVPDYQSFSKSGLYGAFVRFGRHLINTNAVNPMAFIDFLIQSEAGIDQWESIGLYQQYLRILTTNESPTDALERNIMLMEQWAIANNENWTDFFRKVSPAQATLWIETGRISPWIWFLAPSAEELLGRMSEEQATIVGQSFNAGFWKQKLVLHETEVKTIQQELEAAGI